MTAFASFRHIEWNGMAWKVDDGSKKMCETETEGTRERENMNSKYIEEKLANKLNSSLIESEDAQHT